MPIYAVIFFLTLLQGPTMMTLGGFLLRLGQARFWPLYGVLMAADLTGDSLWYAIGYYYARPFARRYGRFFGITEKLLDTSERVFKKYQYKILFLSKITMGLGFALVILMTAGMLRIPFKKYFAFNALGQFFWTGFLLSIGYFFGNLYLIINQGFARLSFFAMILLLVATIYGFGQYLRKKSLTSQL